ncbi:MAG: YdcF family protein [Candidatus Eisenbacteria bacterium]
MSPDLRGLRNAVALVAAAFGVSALALVFAGTRDRLVPAALLVVPGNLVHADGTLSPRLEARCAKALELWRAGAAPVLFVSGGVEPNGMDEAACMKHWLTAHGVPDSAVVADPLGANSWRTARNAAAWLSAHDRHGAVVVTQGFHVPRMALACRRAGIAPVGQAHARFFEPRDVYSIARELPGLLRYATRPARED